MAKLKINLQDLAFAFLNDDPDLDPHLNMETGELVDNSSTYYTAPAARMVSRGDEEEEGAEGEAESSLPDESEEAPDDDFDEGYDQMTDFDKFVQVKPLSDKGHHAVIQEFIKTYHLEDLKELTSLKFIKDFEYKVKADAKLHEKWMQYKTEKFKFIASRWMEMNKIRADLV